LKPSVTCQLLIDELPSLVTVTFRTYPLFQLSALDEQDKA
jgi:hypothetical protein